MGEGVSEEMTKDDRSKGLNRKVERNWPWKLPNSTELEQESAGIPANRTPANIHLTAPASLLMLGLLRDSYLGFDAQYPHVSVNFLREELHHVCPNS
jgi:hypothetical protein